MAKTLAGALLCLVIAVTPGLAGADEENGLDHRIEVGVGALIGRSDVGPLTGPGVGVHLDVLHQFKRIGLMAEYNFLGVGDSERVGKPAAVRGLEHRLGGVVRYNIGEFDATILNLAVWGEAGVGREWIRWDGGGKLTRNDIAVGFGMQPTFQIGKNHHGSKTIGYYMAVRFDIANAPVPPKALPPICAGPCDEPTGPAPYDYNIFFNFGVTFGR